MKNSEKTEEVLNLWHLGVGAAEIGRRFNQNRDWARRIVRKAAKANDHRAKQHTSGNIIGAEREGRQLRLMKQLSH